MSKSYKNINLLQRSAKTENTLQWNIYSADLFLSGKSDSLTTLCIVSI